MAASSISKNIVVSSQRQVERFADVIEDSYQEFFYSEEKPDLRITHLHGPEEVKKIMKRRKKKM